MMLDTFMRTALRRLPSHLRHITVVRPAAPRDLVATVYAQSERDFGMVAPPVSLHAPAPRVLAACWLMLRETLLADGLVDRAVKEAIATAVSLGNACPYCVEVHTTTLHGLLKIPSGTRPMDDPAVRDIAAWARAGGTRDSAARHGVPFPLEQTPELVGVAVAFQYLNRMVNVFLGESPIPKAVPVAARGGVQRMLARYLSSTAGHVREPGASLDLLPDAPLPDDLSWAAGNPSIAGAFARAAAVIEAAGVRSVPDAVRHLVLSQLAEWDGAPLGIGSTTIDDAVSRLSVTDRPAGRLALLTALASHQVTEPVIDQFRRTEASDESLVEVTSWASLAAARQAGSWLPFRPFKP
jgi:alkylhydroperoxidase family enzyme